MREIIRTVPVEIAVHEQVRRNFPPATSFIHNRTQIRLYTSCAVLEYDTQMAYAGKDHDSLAVSHPRMMPNAVELSAGYTHPQFHAGIRFCGAWFLWMVKRNVALARS